jgi:very-short-patch-repair endonuclease
MEKDPLATLIRFARRMPAGTAFSGYTAAWLHGLDVAPCNPIEVTIPKPFGITRRAGGSVRRSDLAAGEIVIRKGLPATPAIRTVVELAGRTPLTEAVVVADLALHATLVTLAQLRAYVAAHTRARGIARVRRVLDFVEPKAESAMETRLRMLLVLAGLPRPQVQVPLCDNDGRWLGRPDLLYRDQRLVLEYDGGNHRERLVDDDRRQNRLIGSGLRILRFTAADVYGAPESVVADVRRAIAARASDEQTS